MATLALSAAETVVPDGTTYVSYAGTDRVKAFLASDHDADEVVRFESTSTGTIEVVDHAGRRLGFVGSEASGVAILKDDLGWQFEARLQAPATLVAAADATYGQPEADLINALRTIAISLGHMKAE